MNIQLEKKQIIEELWQRDEEWLIIAIKKLLGLDTADDFSSEHKRIIEERTKLYDADPDNIITIEELMQELKAEGKL